MEHVPTVGGVPKVKPRRWPKVLGALAGLFVALVVAGFATGFVHVYDGPRNAGIAIGGDCSNVGVEWRGDPGFFHDACD